MKMDVVELMEYMAEGFYRKTRYMSPIKDRPRASGGYSPELEAKISELWSVYTKAFHDGAEWSKEQDKVDNYQGHSD